MGDFFLRVIHIALHFLVFSGSCHFRQGRVRELKKVQKRVVLNRHGLVGSKETSKGRKRQAGVNDTKSLDGSVS